MHFTERELIKMGFAEVGADVRIHRSAQLFGCEFMSIGSNVRIDCFALLSASAAGLEIGSCVHIAAGSYLFGSGGRLVMENFSGLSSRVCVYTASDDYSGACLTNPTIPDSYRSVESGDVILREHVIVGCGSVILPGVTIGRGAAIGALSCVSRDVRQFETFGGRRVIGQRERGLLEVEADFRASDAGRAVFGVEPLDRGSNATGLRQFANSE